MWSKNTSISQVKLLLHRQRRNYRYFMESPSLLSNFKNNYSSSTTTTTNLSSENLDIKDGIVLSAIQPTGDLTLGNYLGSVKNWVKLQHECKSAIFSIVDLHAITIARDPRHLRESIREMAI